MPPARSTFIHLAIGLAFLTAGQVGLSFGRAFINAQWPVDWSHWFLLIGAVWSAVAFSTYSGGKCVFVGRLLVLAGAIGFVGMCTIDFIMWAMPDVESRTVLYEQTLRRPQIAGPFLEIGPNLLYIGFVVLAVAWWRTAKVLTTQFIVSILACGLANVFGDRWHVAVGHAMIFGAALALALRKTPPTNAISS